MKGDDAVSAAAGPDAPLAVVSAGTRVGPLTAPELRLSCPAGHIDQSGRFAAAGAPTAAAHRPGHPNMATARHHHSGSQLARHRTTEART